jgi:thioesterase domain-containing protein
MISPPINSVSRVFESLLQIGASIRLGEGGRLLIEAPQGSIHDALRQAITEQRAAIVDTLQRQRIPAGLDTITVALMEMGRASDVAAFCFHGFQGTVGFYRPLAAVLAQRADVYGVQAVGVDLKRKGLSSLEEMADYYAAQIECFTVRMVFVGWCVGAPLAIETAKRLREKGRPVERVICADPWLGQQASHEDRWRDFLAIYLSERPLELALAESAQLTSRHDRIHWLAHQRRVKRPNISLEQDIATLTQRLDFWESTDTALRQYQHTAHAETVDLYLSESHDQAQEQLLKQLGANHWQPLSPTLPAEQGYAALGTEILKLLH